MHLRLEQTARHDAQNKTSRHNQGHYRFHAQSDRLQPDPHSQIADGLADSAHNQSVAPRVRRQKDRKSATLHVLQRTASTRTPWTTIPANRDAMSDLDVIIIGAGHNGLTCAAYLAMAGLRVQVFERRGIVGGACVTEEI